MKLFFLALIFTGCVKSGFGGSSKKQDATVAQSSSPPSTTNSAVLQSPAPSACVSSSLSFHFTFVIDATGSMRSYLDLVKSNVGAFAQAIRTALGASLDANSKIYFSAVTYVDVVADNINVSPTDDVSAFAKQLDAVKAPRGGINDHCEGGLMAAEEAAKLQSAANLNIPNLVPAIIVISDNWSHSGVNSSTRDFNAQNFATALNGPLYAKNLVLIDAVPTSASGVSTTGGGCSNHPTSPPSAQWDVVRQAWLSKHAGANSPGSSVGFPLDANILLQQIPGLVAKAITCP